MGIFYISPEPEPESGSFLHLLLYTNFCTSSMRSIIHCICDTAAIATTPFLTILQRFSIFCVKYFLCCQCQNWSLVHIWLVTVTTTSTVHRLLIRISSLSVSSPRNFNHGWGWRRLSDNTSTVQLDNNKGGGGQNLCEYCIKLERIGVACYRDLLDI